MPSPWQWDDASKRYRNVESGRYIGQRQMVSLRDVFTEAMKGDTDRMTRQLANGEISLGRWQLDMQSRVKQVITDQYALSVGGRNAMAPSDWGRVGRMTQDQYRYLEQFAAEIRTGKLSAGQIQTRARMYMNSGTAAYEKGNAASRGMPGLPQYPGDGGTQCRTNCQCHWDIGETDTEWQAFWRLGVAEHCPDCVALADLYNPWTAPKV